jgi:8-oxo-dGTP diphosphatase
LITIRVYGIVVIRQSILVSDELIRGMRITKFCGGGLEEGEGTKTCLQREFKEELGIDVTIGEHIYTTDFYQPSAFRKGDQILSIYYRVYPNDESLIVENNTAFNFTKSQLEAYEQTKQIESVRLIPLEQFSANDVTLPIDKVVAQIIQQSNLK